MGRNGTPEREARIRQAAIEKALAALREGASTRQAAEAANVSRSTLQAWREQDEEFAQAWVDAYNDGTDLLEDEARRRGTEGWEEPVFQKGEHVGDITRYSDTLLLRSLERRRPEAWRANHRIEHTGNGGGPIEIDLRGLREQLATRLDALAERRAASQ